MKHRYPWAVAALAAFLLALPASAQNKPPAKKPGTPGSKTEEESKMVKAGVITGQLVSFDENKKLLKVKVTITYAEPNQGAIQGYAQEQQNYANAIARRDANAARQHQQNMATHARNFYTVKSTSRDLNVEPADDETKVRLAKPKEEFDDMGNIKKPTAKELAEKRGKDKLYDGEFSDLAANQFVSVYLVKPKTTKPMKKDDPPLDTNLKASKIVILKEATK